jgi:hypothetical protein
MSAASRAVELHGNLPADHRKYQTDKLAACVELFRSALGQREGMSSRHIITFCASGFPELSPAAQWKEGVLPAHTHIRLLEMALWAVQPAVLGQLADPLPDRMKLFLRRIAPDDVATNPLLLRLVQKSREAGYMQDPTRIQPESIYRPSTKPNAMPGDLEPHLCRATPAQRDLTDKYDNPNAPAADLFARPDPASNVLPADIELLIAAQEALIPPELLDSVIRLRATRPARMTCAVPPTAEDIFFTAYSGHFTKPSITEQEEWRTITPHRVGAASRQSPWSSGPPASSQPRF